MSTSSEDVFFCHDLQEIQVATGTIVGKRNFLDVVNADVLAQTYLDGPIYVVNSVSHRGRHTTSDVWQFDFERTPLKGIRMLEHSLLGPDFDHFADLIDYNNRALDALGIANGPSHTELKLTPNGPSMIETGSRLMGATIEEVHFRRSLEKTQVDLTALSVSAPEEFAPWVGTIQKPTLPLSIIWVHFDADGFIDSDEGLQQLNEITSVVGRYGLPHVGDQITPAGDTTGQHGFIYLQNEDPSVVQRDARRVRRLVRDQALFSVAQRKAG